MITAEILKALRAIALAKAQKPDYEYSYRKICRWYSREFSTPLQAVYEMSEETVLMTYFEDVYERIVSDTDTDEGVQRYEKLKDDILGKSEEEDAQHEAEDAKWEQEMIEEIRRSEEEAKKKGQVRKDPNLDKTESIHRNFEDIPDFDE